MYVSLKLTTPFWIQLYIGYRNYKISVKQKYLSVTAPTDVLIRFPIGYWSYLHIRKQLDQSKTSYYILRVRVTQVQVKSAHTRACTLSRR